MIYFDEKLIRDKNPWLSELILLEDTASTQDEVRGAANNTLCIANTQNRGYGRFKREFFSSKNGGIYMSINLGSCLFQNPSEITLLSAVAIVSSIEKLTRKKPSIKWVNDIYLNHKKVAGILAEYDGQNLVLGIGINFFVTDFPEELSNQATSIFDEKDKPTVTKSEFIGEIWSEFYRLKDSDYLSIYKDYCFILGKTIFFRQNSQNYEGLAVDLTKEGHLIVNCADGVQRVLHSGEISLKLNKMNDFL